MVAPDDPTLADVAGSWAGAYLHLPFCARLCPYCDFAVVVGRDDQARRYVDAVLAEIQRSDPWRPLDAVFVGGGTPSRVPADDVARLLDALGAVHGLAPDAEVTMEANPEDWSPRVAEAYLAAGVGRVSFGVQSMDLRVLIALGRRHRPAQAAAAVRDAKRAGVASVSVDLIYGHPLETDASWASTLGDVVALEPDHVSTYALTVEHGTDLGRRVAAGAPAPDPDTQADRWEAAAVTLGAAGFTRYEVSNHARDGHPCRYNLAVWGAGEYLAHGLAAHSHRDGARTRNVRSLDTYLSRVEEGESPVATTETVAGWDAEVERVFLGLRRAAGVVAGEAGRALLDSPEGRRLVDAGALSSTGGRLVADPLLVDMVARTLLAVERPAQDVG